jgi:DNA polymerase I-like protein with 3'-5' exonuclease and polymerase domains
MSTTINGKAAFPSTPREAVPIYVQHGLGVVPLPTRSKAPEFEDWPAFRFDLADLDRHFPANVEKNVAILNGELSHCEADVDLDGTEARAVAPFLLPRTSWIFGRQSTPRAHYIYRTSPAHPSAQTKFLDPLMKPEDAKTVLCELRGTGGITVYPPGKHKETGEPIRWDTFEGEPAEVPLDLLQRAVGDVASASLLARYWPCKGSRDDAAMALSGGLARAGWDAEKVSRFCRAVAVAAGDEEAAARGKKAEPTARKQQEGKKTTGWPRLAKLLGSNGNVIVAQVREWLGMVRAPVVLPSTSTRKVRTLQPCQPFPVEALPLPLQEYVRQGALALGCDPAYLALPALAVAASVIGNTRTIRLKRTWTEPAVVWAAVVADSGGLKTPAYLLAVQYLFGLQRKRLDEYRAKMDQYREDMRVHEAAERAAKKAGGAGPGPPPAEPTLERVLVADVTIEKLAEILEDNPRGILVARDELAGWLGSFSRYKGKGGGTDLPHWLEMHRAGTVLVDRKTGERRHYFVQRAAVSVTGGIQPGVLAHALTPEFLDAGLAARLLMAMPPKLPKRWSECEVALVIEQAYQGNLDRLLALDFDTRDGQPVPHAIGLSQEGKAAWVRFYNDWAQEQAAAEGELAAAFSKLEAYAARFALIHHVIGRAARGEDDLVPVERESVEAGVVLCRWFAVEARRIYSTLSESTEERDTRRLVEFVQARGGRINARALQKSNSRKFPTADAAEVALDMLVQDGMARWVEHATTERGGRPTRFCELLPTPDTTDTTPDVRDDDDTPPPPPTSDTTPDTTPPTPYFPGGNRGCVGNVGCRTETFDSATGVESPAETDGGCVGRLGVVSGSCVGHAGGPPSLLVRDRAGLEMVRAALDEADVVALDLETTGLSPRQDRPRLLSLALPTTDGTLFAYLVDLDAIDARPVLESLTGKDLVGHNLVFDLGFLDRLGFTPSGKVHDTMHLSRILHAGEGSQVKHDLAACVERDLGEPLDKTEQRSDWSGALTDSQIAYAARDVLVLPPLLDALRKKLAEAKLEQTAEIETRCLPALAWMSARGVAVDRPAWLALVETAEAEARRRADELDRIAPPRPGEFFTPWKWTSPQDVKEVFALLGFPIEDTEAETIAQIEHPIVAPFLAFKENDKRVHAFGRTWLENVHDGRLYPSWNQTGAKTGRMSCSEPNLQQTPRDPAYRRCVVAPPGRVLIKADYSQIELRIAARIADDERMIDAYRRGEDLHTLTARNMTGRAEVTKQERQLAKPVNFGLIYGLSARTLRVKAKVEYGVELTAEQAESYRATFFNTYRGIARWHIRLKMSQFGETRTLAGRRVLVEPKVFYGSRANYAVQGTCGDGIKLALALLWERRDQVPGVFPVMAVHDEIVVEAGADQADAVAGWLRQAMLDAMAPLIVPVPVEVEVQVARTWGGD